MLFILGGRQLGRRVHGFMVKIIVNRNITDSLRNLELTMHVIMLSKYSCILFFLKNLIRQLCCFNLW